MTRWSSLGENWANVGNTPYRFYKNFSYEGGINTPLIAYWPGVIEPGSFNRFPGHFIDIMATLVEITGAEYPESFNGQQITPMQGESLVTAFKGESDMREKPLFWEWRRGQAVREGNWKIVREGLDKSWDLYNLEVDPTEINNLAEKDPERVKAMEKMFQDWKNEVMGD